MYTHTSIILIVLLAFANASLNKTLSSENHARPKRGAAAIASMIFPYILPGATLLGSSIYQIQAASQHAYSVAATIKIENHTKWDLKRAWNWIKWGQIKHGPTRVNAGKMEVWEAHKTTGTVAGTAGTIQYNVGGLNQWLGITWHAPYNFNFLSNFLSIGIFVGNSGWHQSNLYDRMKNGHRNYPTSNELCRQYYYYGIVTCRATGAHYTIEATMGTSHHPLIDVRIYANEARNMAPSPPT